MAVADEPVISEVHMETCPPHTSSWCTRFCFSLPVEQHSPSHVSCSNTTYTHSTSEAAEAIGVDEDGDAFIPRRPKRKDHFILVNHSVSTAVSRCGEQVWMGACLLADFIISHQQLFAGETVAELGAGVGLASIMAAQFASAVFLTDADPGALQLARLNVAVNHQLQPQRQQLLVQEDVQLAEVQHGRSQQRQSSLESRVMVRRLDWLQLFDTQLHKLSSEEFLQILNTPMTAATSSSRASCVQEQLRQADSTAQELEQSCPAGPALHPPQHQQQLQLRQGEQLHQWQEADLAILASTSVWLAADVVYNETLTDAFLRTAHQLMCWQRKQREDPYKGDCASSRAECLAGSAEEQQNRLPRLFVAIEKRYNFTFRDLDARASAFDHFMTYIRVADSTGVPRQQKLEQLQDSTAASGGLLGDEKPLFLGRRWEVDSIPQALQYDRSKDLELWELMALPSPLMGLSCGDASQQQMLTPSCRSLLTRQS